MIEKTNKLSMIEKTNKLSMIEKTNKLSNEVLNGYREASKKVGEFEQLITNRINHIVQTICQVFGKNLNYWHFYGAGEGEMGNIDIGDGVSLQVSWTAVVLDPYFVAYVLIKEGECNLTDSFPSRWLIEDFEEELMKGKLKHFTREKDRKLKVDLRAAEKKTIAKSAKLKLSKKELNALGLK